MNNYDSINFFIRLVESGILVIRDNGSIWALKERKNQYDFKDIIPKRIDKTNKFNYSVVCMRWQGNTHKCFAHRLVWAYFNHVNKLPTGMQINHKDGIRNNNHINNLELVTPSENIRHAMRTGLKKKRYGEDHHLAQLKNNQIKEIRPKLKTKTDKELAVEYNVKPHTIRNIRNNKSYTTIL